MEINIRITGEAGQGIAAAAAVLGKTVTRCGYFAHSYNDAESRVRGGLNFNHLRVSTQPRRGTTGKVDILVALSEQGAKVFGAKLSEEGVLLQAKPWEALDSRPSTVGDDLEKRAKEAGSKKVLGTVGVATVCGLMGVDPQVLKTALQERFTSKKKVIQANLDGVDAGYELARSLKRDDLRLAPPAGEEGKDPSKASRLWMGGAQVVAGGALAGGLGFMAAYPMSPSTGVIINLGRWAKETGVVVVQAEDEVGAINMVAGASYAGARSMVATSGGGFALMEEGVSLLGMIECPAVIVVAQRPGPATGLPTRQAQGDLHMVLRAGHGHFPRVVVARRDFQEGLTVSARASDSPGRIGGPVFVLTDQHFQDSQSTLEALPSQGLPKERHLLDRETLEQLQVYRRYENTESGVSPMAAPGISKHVVVVDSDEHDQEGHLTESAEEAQLMIEKRLRKERHLARAMDEDDYLPVTTGEVSGNPLVISWGSTHPTVSEAVEAFREGAGPGGETERAVAHTHLSWLWPAPRRELERLLEAASKVVVVENNVDGQLVQYLRQVTGVEVDEWIGRLDGRPLLVEELVGELEDEFSS